MFCAPCFNGIWELVQSVIADGETEPIRAKVVPRRSTFNCEPISAKAVPRRSTFNSLQAADVQKFTLQSRRHTMRNTSGQSLASTREDSESFSSSSSSAGTFESLEEESRALHRPDVDKLRETVGSMRPWDKRKWKVERRLSAACGNFGRVDIVSRRNSETPELVAVKSVPLRWLRKGPSEFAEKHPDSIENPWEDVRITKHLNTKGFSYAVDFMGVYCDGNTAYIMTSLATEGDLFGWSQDCEIWGLEREALISPIVRQIFDAIRWLHDAGIAHLDLSLENILLTRRGEALEVKIIDYGMATRSPQTCFGVRAKPSYQAPEMHQAPRYDGFPADAFALGVTLFGLAYKKYPWSSTIPGRDAKYEFMRSHGFRAHLIQNFRNDLSEAFSAPFVSLLSGLLATAPNKRWCLGETCFQLSHPNNKEERPSVWNSDWIGAA